MSHVARYATLIDGAFVIRKLEARRHAFPTANKRKIELSKTQVYADHARLLKELEMKPDIALSASILRDSPSREQSRQSSLSQATAISSPHSSSLVVRG